MSLSRRDFQVQSARAIWGHAWLIIHPTILILLYTFVFAGVLGARLPGSIDPFGYGAFLCVGLINWNLFNELVGRCQSMFLENADMLKTLRVPRSVLPAAATLTAVLRYAIILGVFLVVLAATGRWPGWVLLAGVPLLATHALLGIGLGILSGTLNVFFRDIGQATVTVLQLWFWMTPIVYPLAIVPDSFRALISLNPLTPITLGYQEIVVEGRAPDPLQLLWPAAFALVVAIGGWLVFRALGSDMVDEL